MDNKGDGSGRTRKTRGGSPKNVMMTDREEEKEEE